MVGATSAKITMMMHHKSVTARTPFPFASSASESLSRGFPKSNDKDEWIAYYIYDKHP